jgi:hypothetical protein
MSNAERGNQVQQSSDGGKTWQDAKPLKGPSMWFVHRWLKRLAMWLARP